MPKKKKKKKSISVRGSDLFMYIPLQHRVEQINLLPHSTLARTAGSVLQLHRPLVIQTLLHIGPEPAVDALQLLERQGIHGDTVLFRQRDDTARDVVGLTEGDAFADEIVGEFRGKHFGGQCGGHLVRVDRQGGQDARGDLQTVADGLDVVEQWLDAFLQVLVVCRREALDGHHQAGHLPEGAAAFAAEKLEAVGILLLRHQRRAGRVGVGQAHEAELEAAVDDQVLGPAGDLDHERAAPLHGLEGKVPVGDRVHGVGQQAIKAQLARHRVSVDMERVAGQRPRAQWAAVHPLDDLTQTLQFRRKGDGVRQQPLTPPHRLRFLQVRITRHDVVNFISRARRRNLDQLNQIALQLPQLVPQPEPHVRSDLLITRATRVQLARDLLANDLPEPPLICRVDILVVLLHDKRVGAPFLGNLSEAALDLAEFMLGQDPTPHVRTGKRDRALDVLLPEDPVIGQGLVVLHHEGVEALSMIVSLDRN